MRLTNVLLTAVFTFFAVYTFIVGGLWVIASLILAVLAVCTLSAKPMGGIK